MKKSQIYILIFLLGVGINTLNAQENVKSEIVNEQAVTNKLLPGESPEINMEVTKNSIGKDERIPDDQRITVKREITNDNQETLLPGEFPTVENANTALQEDPKQTDAAIIAKDEINQPENEEILLPGEHPVTEVNNSGIVQEEMRYPEEQNTIVPNEQNIPSQNDQPKGEKSEQLIDYRSINGPDSQPKGEKSESVVNYRAIKGNDTQPEGEPKGK